MSLLLLAGTLDRALADLHARRLGLLGLRDADLENTILEVGLNVVRIDALRERHGASETAEGPLDAPVALAGLLSSR